MTNNEFKYLSSQTQDIENLVLALQSLTNAYEFPTPSEEVIDDIAQQVDMLGLVISAFNDSELSKHFKNKNDRDDVTIKSNSADKVNDSQTVEIKH